MTVSDSVVLTRGWQTFARARARGKRCTLHFKYDYLATLYVRVFREDGCRVGCCPEDGSDDDGGDGELGIDGARSSPVMAALPRTRARAAVATTGLRVVLLVSRTPVVRPAAVFQ